MQSLEMRTDGTDEVVNDTVRDVIANLPHGLRELWLECHAKPSEDRKKARRGPNFSYIEHVIGRVSNRTGKFTYTEGSSNQQQTGRYRDFGWAAILFEEKKVRTSAALHCAASGGGTMSSAKNSS